MAKNRRVTLIALSALGAVVALATLYGLLFGVQTAAVLLVKQPRADRPEMYRLPQHLEVRSTPRAARAKLASFGYEFEAPWADVLKKDVRPLFARISFRSGKEIVVFNPSEAVDLLDEFRTAHPEHADRVVSIFGDTAMKSNYALYQSILNVTPDDLSIFMSKHEAVRLSILLILKGMLTVNADSGVYSFEYRDVRGFQFGDPARTNKVVIHVFDEDDRKLELLVFVRNGAAGALSQDEITHVIQTLRPAA